MQLNTDIDTMSRAAFLAVFADEVKQGDAHAFFFNYTMWQTIDERERILREIKGVFSAFKSALPVGLRDNFFARWRAG